MIHSTVDDCTVNIAPADAPSELLQQYPQIFGLRSWLIEGYEENTFYIHKDLRLELSQNEDEDCIDAQATVLSKDILTISEEEIPATEVVYTIVGGEVKYRRGG